MKKIFKKYGRIDEFSWKGKYFFVVLFSKFNSRLMKKKKKPKEQSEK
jgi:hypothetical protein